MGELYLMSIKPKYAYRIFTGIKRFELRKWFGLVPPRGSIIIVYASGSVKAIIGEFKVGRVFMGSPSDVWSYLERQENTGVGREDYSYIHGSRKAMAIEVIEPRLYNKPIRLSELKSIIPDFMPPLSFRRIDPYEPLYQLVIRRARLSIK